MTGLSAEEADGVHRAAREKCDDVQRYLKELHYALYCYFLQNTTPAYIEVPAAFKLFFSPITLADMLHKLHGRLVDRAQFLNDHPENPNNMYPRARSPTSPTVSDAMTSLRQSLCRRLYNVALSEWPVDDIVTDSALLMSPTSVLVVPPMDRSFLILKQEYDTGEEEIANYFDERDGIVFHAVRRLLYYSRLGIVEGERAAAEKMRQESERLAKLAAEFAKEHQSTSDGAAHGDSVLGTSSFVPSALGDTNGTPKAAAATAVAASGKRPLTSLEMTFCAKCNTCSVCCVCSLVQSPARRRASPPR